MSVIDDHLARSLLGCVGNATQQKNSDLAFCHITLLFTGERSYLWERCTVLSFFHSTENVMLAALLF